MLQKNISQLKFVFIMKKIKSLNSHLKILQLFGLQFFSLNSLNPYHSQTTENKLKISIIFLTSFTIYPIISSYYYINGFVTFEDVASSHNYIQYEFKVITYAGRFLIILSSIAESFASVKKMRKIFIHAWKIQKILKIELNYDKLRRVMTRRLILVICGLIFFEILPICTKNVDFHEVLMCVSKFIGTMIMSLAVFKYCFYIDLINLHLVHFIDVVER